MTILDGDQECARHGVYLEMLRSGNSISPGTSNTPIVRIAATQIDPERTNDLIASWGRLHPLGRVGLPSEVAGVVLFLASGDASFITGSDFGVDDGLRASLIPE